jgi:hypothetical protein
MFYEFLMNLRQIAIVGLIYFMQKGGWPALGIGRKCTEFELTCPACRTKSYESTGWLKPAARIRGESDGQANYGDDPHGSCGEKTPSGVWPTSSF